MRGIALEGGGAKGAYHIGAIKALRELGIDFDVVTGTSIGAINGALIASDNLELTEKLWLSTELNDIVNGDAEMIKKIINYEFREDPKKVRDYIIEIFKQGGLDISPFKKEMRKIISEEKVRASKIDFGLVALSLTDLKPITLFKAEIPEGKLHDYIFASSNLPAFKDERFDDKKMIDGAFYDNLPINMLIEKGCDEIIAIRLNATGRVRKVHKSHQDKVIYVTPSENLGKSLEVDPVKAEYNIKMGYYDAIRTLKGYHGSRYYITDLMDEATIINEIKLLPDAIIEKINQFLNSEKFTKRIIFEDVIPMISTLLKMDSECNYSEILLKFYEFLAEEAGIERFKFMSFLEFMDRVDAVYKENYASLSKAEKIISKRLFSLLPNRSVILLQKKMQKVFLVNLYLILMNARWNTGVPK